MKQMLWAGIVVCLSAIVVDARDIEAPYTQRGWVTVDRWGGMYICNRTYELVAVTRKLAKELKPYRDRFVTCDVTQIQDSISTDGPWRIDAVSRVEPGQSLQEHDYHMQLQADVSRKDNVKQVHFQLALHCQGHPRRRIGLDDIRFVIVKKKRVGERPPQGYFLQHEISDGPSYVFHNRTLSGDLLRHPDITDVEIQSEHPTDWHVNRRMQLPAGEYEAWLTYRDPMWDDEMGTRSNTVGFTVTEPAVTTTVEQLIQDLASTPWAGPLGPVIPSQFLFRFTSPMQEIIRMGPGAQDALIAALSDPEILDQAIILLGAVGDERAIPHIIDAMIPDEDYSNVKDAYYINRCANLALMNITSYDAAHTRKFVDQHPYVIVPAEREMGLKESWSMCWELFGETFKVKDVRRDDWIAGYGVYTWEATRGGLLFLRRETPGPGVLTRPE